MVQKKSPHAMQIVHEKSEYIDWVNLKTGKVLGRITKKFAHDFGLSHRAAHLFVFDAKNNLVLQKRGKWMVLQPGRWDTSAGGHVSAGESVERAAEREAWEEIHARGKIHRLGNVTIHDVRKTYDNVEGVTFFWMKSVTPLRSQKSEVEKLIHLPLEKVDDFLKKNECTPWMKAAWKKYSPKILRAGVLVKKKAVRTKTVGKKSARAKNSRSKRGKR